MLLTYYTLSEYDDISGTKIGDRIDLINVKESFVVWSVISKEELKICRYTRYNRFITYVKKYIVSLFREKI